MTTYAAHGVHSMVCEEVLKLRPASILDVGCGNGELMKSVAKPGMRMVGIDIDNQWNLGFEFHRLDAGKPFNLQMMPFDVVVSTEVVEHVHDHMVYLTNLYKHVKPGGYAIITSPNTSNIISKTLFVACQELYDCMASDYPVHVNPVILPLFLRKCTTAGFKIVKIKYSIWHVPLSNIYINIKSKHLAHTVMVVLRG